MQFDINSILKNLKDIELQHGSVTSQQVSQQLLEHNVSFLHIKDVMDAIRDSGIIIEDETQTEDVQKRADNFTFSEIDIYPGTTLVFTKNPQRTCTVVSDKKVSYQGEEYYLSGLAKILLHEEGYNWSSVRGPQYFTTVDNPDTLDVRFQNRKKKEILHVEKAPVLDAIKQVDSTTLELPIEQLETEEEMIVRVVQYGKEFWRRAKEFAEKHSNIKIIEKGILAYYFRFNHVTGKQAKVLVKFLNRITQIGFEIE